MAYVDLKSKKIVGAKKGTLKWYHEEGHIKFNQSDLGIKSDYRREFYFRAAVSAMILGIFSKTFTYSAVVFILIYWYYFLYEESWCWNYAFKKMKGGID